MQLFQFCKNLADVKYGYFLSEDLTHDIVSTFGGRFTSYLNLFGRAQSAEGLCSRRPSFLFSMSPLYYFVIYVFVTGIADDLRRFKEEHRRKVLETLHLDVQTLQSLTQPEAMRCIDKFDILSRVAEGERVHKDTIRSRELTYLFRKPIMLGVNPDHELWLTCPYTRHVLNQVRPEVESLRKRFEM